MDMNYQTSSHSAEADQSNTVILHEVDMRMQL